MKNQLKSLLTALSLLMTVLAVSSNALLAHNRTIGHNSILSFTRPPFAQLPDTPNTMVIPPMVARMRAGAQPPVTANGTDVTITGVAGTTVTNLDYTDLRRWLAGKIAFFRPSSAGDYIYTMNADGSNLYPLSTGSEPAWSPDGTQIAFIDRAPYLRQVFKMNAEGRVTQLTRRLAEVIDPELGDWFPSDPANPAWSPDGSQIVFDLYTRTRLSTWECIGGRQLYAVDADGTTRTRLTRLCPAQADNASWSSNNRIAFVRYDENHRIYELDPDGEVTPLIPGTETRFDPAWSPDGTRIAYAQVTHDYSHIYVMNLDGSGEVRRLTDGFVNNSHPTWSPDGRRIAFQRGVGDHWQVCTMDARDGSGIQQLTFGQIHSLHPEWTVGSVPRVVLGLNGLLGTEAGGFILGTGSPMGLNGQNVTSVLTFDTRTASDWARAEARISSQTTPAQNVPLLLFAISAQDGIGNIGFINGDLGEQGSNPQPIALSMPDGATDAVIAFNSQSGHVTAVIARGATATKPGGTSEWSVEQGMLIYRGGFIAVFDSKGKKLGANGGSMVRFDAQTGALLDVK